VPGVTQLAENLLREAFASVDVVETAAEVLGVGRVRGCDVFHQRAALSLAHEIHFASATPPPWS
jgi:hypothetical protein